MFTLQECAIERFEKELLAAYRQTYSNIQPQIGNIVAWVGRLALENIANSDTLYHNVEHTIMISLVGQAILKGKHLCEGGVTPRDWLHFMMGVLCHDIGFVKGICRADRDGRYAIGVGGKTIALPPGGTNVALTPYHVDRAKLFIRERFGGELVMNIDVHIDAEVIASYIEMTRFPVPDGDFYKDTKSYAGVVRRTLWANSGIPITCSRSRPCSTSSRRWAPTKSWATRTRVTCAEDMPSSTGMWSAPISRTPCTISV
jgi:hypothetical protein